MKLFTPEDRTRVRERLLDLARSDDRIVGAALTGSAARGDEDRWSDVDVFLGVAEDVDIGEVLAGWTDMLYEEFGALHHWDVTSGAAIYRVFLLPTCLQVDVAFTPAPDFGARGPHFRAVFGSPIEQQGPPLPAVGDIVGRGWLALLHANSSIERQRLWQAEYWISSARDDTLALACLRLGQSPFYAKALHLLPPSVTVPLEAALARSTEAEELRRALRVACRCLMRELRYVDPALAGRIEGPLRELTGG